MTTESETLCPHVQICGGCAFQDMAAEAYLAHKSDAVKTALTAAGLDVTPAPMFSVPPHTRRRATFRAVKEKDTLRFGFHEARSHSVVDIRECRVLTPGLEKLIPGLRKMFCELMKNGQSADVKVTETEAGADIALRWAGKADPAQMAQLAQSAQKLGVARITRNGAPMVEMDRPFVHLGKGRVPVPPDVFLQPTREGERMLQACVKAALGKAKKIADLFCGCGTFTLPLAEKANVHAVDLAGDHLKALEAAAKCPGIKPLTIEKRNLFKLPLSARELAAYDGVVLDPPRAGAEAQARELAQTKLKTIVYVSCNPETFARDAKILSDGGFQLKQLMPVDQFLWSTHTELVASFRR